MTRKLIIVIPTRRGTISSTRRAPRPCQQLVQRRQISLGAGDDDVGAGTVTAERAGIGSAGLRVKGLSVLAIMGLDTDGHFAHGVDPLSNRVDAELGQRVGDSHDAIDGLVDGVHRTGAVSRVAEDFPIWPQDANRGRRYAVVAARDLDMFQGNDHQENFMFRNEGDSFTEVGVEIGVAVNSHGMPTGSMHGAIGDVDGDGREDVAIGAFYHNNTTGRVYIITGKDLSDHGTGDFDPTSATAVINGTATGEYLGQSIGSYFSSGTEGY